MTHARDPQAVEHGSGVRNVVPALMVPSDDQELMSRAKEGDARAFGQLVRSHQRRVYRVALHLLRDSAEAEDVTQDTFVRAYAAIARFDGRSQPYTWFYRIAVNLSLNRLRSRKRQRSVTTEDDPRLQHVDSHPDGAPERTAAERQLARALCQAIDSLSDTLRTTLILVAIDGLPHGEVATILGCPEGTVAWRVHEARRKIRVELDQRGLTAESDPT